MGISSFFWMLVGAFIISTVVESVYGDYKIGVGRADCTGPPVQFNFMGYGKPTQTGKGIHLRQYARCFIIQDDDNKPIVYVNADIAMMGHGVLREVLKQLQTKHKDLYTEDNVIMSGIHTHSGPGGYLEYFLYDSTILGCNKEPFNAIVDGIFKSISRAHDNMQPGRIFLNKGEVDDANINRSPSAYELNPEKERKQYTYNVDKQLVQLKFVSTNKNETIGVFNWFPVHATSMNSTNNLISSDNVGYASILLEQQLNPGKLPGKGDCVAAFASSNLGDVSPNTKGPRCINTGKECDKETSTCDGKAKYCIASGPGKDMVESTRIIAKRIFEKASEMLKSNGQEITGPIKSIHQYVNMPQQKLVVQDSEGNKKTLQGCSPAMGYSFGAGTTDGPGAFGFTQGTTKPKFLLEIVSYILTLGKLTDEDIKCQRPKPILIPTGYMNFPYAWAPKIVSIQIVMIGDLILAAMPGELTTMSGRRMKEDLRQAAKDNGGSAISTVIIAGLCNSYSSYVTTYEEYQAQRYEGASTIYGPDTLEIYLARYRLLLKALLQDKSLERGPIPEDMTCKISLVPPVISDQLVLVKKYGDCVKYPKTVHVGDTVTFGFIAGNPRNDLMHDKSYFDIQKQNGSNWETIATDANWETRFTWNCLSSEMTIRWETDEAGKYRVKHYGHYKVLGVIKAYEGKCPEFTVLHK